LIDPNDLITAQRIQTALNALPTIGPSVRVTVAGFELFDIAFEKNLGNTNVPQLVATPGYPLVIMSTPIEGGMSDNNGITGGPGVCRLQGGTWLNMTAIVSPFRSSVATGQAIAPAQGANPTASIGGINPIVNTP